MLEWWSELGSSDRALVVSAAGVVVAALTFVLNQWHQIRERRRDRMIKVLLAMNNACLPPEPPAGGSVEVDMRPAFAEAYLGLGGKSAEIADAVFRRMREAHLPENQGKNTTEYKAALLENLALDLWKRVHPVRRWFSRPPRYYSWRMVIRD